MKEKLKKALNRKNCERAIYMALIIALSFYALFDLEKALQIMKAVSEAFTLILTT